MSAWLPAEAFVRGDQCGPLDPSEVETLMEPTMAVRLPDALSFDGSLRSGRIKACSCSADNALIAGAYSLGAGR